MKKQEKKPIELTLIPLALTAGLSSYLYLTRNEDEYHNNLYYHPMPTMIQWSPIILTQAIFLLTATTMLILRMYPDRSNYHLTNTQKIIDRVMHLEPEVVAVLNKATTYTTKIAFGERANAINDLVTKGTVIAEQLVRIGIIHERLHTHKIARSIHLDDETMEIRRTEIIVQRINETITHITEVSAAVLYRMALMGLFSRYIPNITEDNKLMALSSIYLIADAVEAGLIFPISKVALAIEIVIDNHIISSMLKSLGIAGNKSIKFAKADLFLREISGAIETAASRMMKAAQEMEENALAELKQLKDIASEEIMILKRNADAEAKQVVEEATALKNKVIEDVLKAEAEAEKRIQNIENEIIRKGQEIEAEAKAEAKRLLDEANAIKNQVAEEIRKVEAEAEIRIKNIEEEIFRKGQQIEAEAKAEAHRILEEARSVFNSLEEDAKIVGTHIQDAVEDITDRLSGTRQSTSPQGKKHYLGETLVKMGRSIGNAITGHHSSSSSSSSAATDAKTQKPAEDNHKTSSSSAADAKTHSLQGEERNLEQQILNIKDYFQSKESKTPDFTMKILEKIKPKSQDEDKKSREEIAIAMEEVKFAKKANETSIIETPKHEFKVIMPFILEGSPLDNEDFYFGMNDNIVLI